MLRCFHFLVLSFVCSVIALPHGWCYLLLYLGCCKAECEPRREVSTSACCSCCSQCEVPEDKNEPSTPCTPQDCSGDCVLCGALAFKPPPRTTGADDLPVLDYVLTFSAAWQVCCAVVEPIPLPQGTGPPLHLLLCVWRC
jgi:hypothetical protein